MPNDNLAFCLQAQIIVQSKARDWFSVTYHLQVSRLGMECPLVTVQSTNIKQISYHLSLVLYEDDSSKDNYPDCLDMDTRTGKQIFVLCLTE